MSEKIFEDRRIQRSKNALWLALLKLINLRDWDQINVREVCDLAGVARSTFYIHFQNKQELLDYGFSQGRVELSEQMDALEANSAIQMLLSWLVEHLSDQTEFKRATNSLNPAIIQRFRATVGDILSEQLRRTNPVLSDFQCQFVTGGIFAVLEEWLKNGRSEPEAKLVAQIEVEIGKINARRR